MAALQLCMEKVLAEGGIRQTMDMIRRVTPAVLLPD
jgi:hypothetical protein